MSNHGPLQPVPNSQSRHSLYTDHSNDSEEMPNNKPIGNQIIGLNNQKILSISNKPPRQNILQQQNILRLPKIRDPIHAQTIQQYQMRVHKLNGQQQQSLPKPSLYDVNPRRRSFHFESDFRSTPNTENIKRFNHSRYEANNFEQPLGYNPITESNSNHERMLRSSQGGRWIRSRSLMNQKEQKSPEFLLRHYHKHGSIMGESLNQHITHLLKIQKELNQKVFKGSIYEPLQLFKNKIQGFLQKKLDLQQVPIDRPDADWNQEELTKFYTNYSPVLSEKMKQINKIKGITLKKYKNCVYFGCMKQGKKDGLGLLHYYSGKFFEGAFQDDYKSEGLEMDDNQLYLGKFSKGLRNGQGILKNDQFLISGTFTDGQFALGKAREDTNRSILAMNSPMNNRSYISHAITRKGFKIDFSSLSIYQNEIVVNKNSSGDIYIGNMSQKQQKNGQGLQIFNNGDVYIGKYEASSPEGYGEYYWDSGAYYRGQFLSGMRHGHGKWHMVQGDSFEGDYMNDKKNGKGTYLWKNGAKYIGDFQNDYRHGYGQMYWQDGRVYKGQWINGIEANKTIKIDQHTTIHPIKNQAKGINTLPKNTFRTLQMGSVNRRKVPMDRLKSIYNPSNNVN